VVLVDDCCLNFRLLDKVASVGRAYDAAADEDATVTIGRLRSDDLKFLLLKRDASVGRAYDGNAGAI
jgi:hypothetical protein